MRIFLVKRPGHHDNARDITGFRRRGGFQRFDKSGIGRFSADAMKKQRGGGVDANIGGQCLQE
jgi:hypothetical protein